MSTVSTHEVTPIGKLLLLQRVSTTMFAALTPCRRSYGDEKAGFECPHKHQHRHIVINESLESGSRVSVVPIPIESVVVLEEVARLLQTRQFFTKEEYNHFLSHERNTELRQKQSAFESGLQLGSGYRLLMNPIVINTIAPD